MKRPWLAGMILLLVGLPAPSGPAPGSQEALELADLAFVTVVDGGDCSPDCAGCAAPSVLAVNRDQPVWRGSGGASGRLTAASDFSRLLVVGDYELLWPGKRYERFRSSVALMRSTSGDWRQWKIQSRIFSDDVAPTGGIAFLPDDDSFLVATCGVVTPQYPEVPPYGVAKYRLSEIEVFESDRGSEWQLGRRRGYLRLPQLAKRIFVTKSGLQAHILTADGFVRTIDPTTMVEIAPAIRLQPDHPVSLKLPLKTGLVYEGDLTDDERYLVTTGLAGERFLNVADLVERRTWTVPLPEGLGRTADLAINKGWLNRGLLALRILGDSPLYRGYVAVYRFQLEGPLEELGRFTIIGEFAPPGHSGPSELYGSALAWSGSGGELILATSICPVPGEGPHCDDPEHSAEWTILAVEDGGRRLVHLHDVTVCRSIGDGDSLNTTSDLLTANGRIPPPATPSPVPSPSATASPLPTATTTATAWPSPSAVITPSPSPVPSPTATLPGSQPPRRLYLPLAARSFCQLRRQFADVVLVLDASTSMAQPTSAGHSKLAAAQEAALSFANLVSLRPDAQGNHDRLAVVAFNDDAWLLVPLSNDLAAVRVAVGKLPEYLAEGTRLDLALERGLAALETAPRRSGNLPALILLTDGLPNRVPTPTPTGSQEDTVLRWAQLARSRAVSVYTIGLGEPNGGAGQGIDIPLLQAIATRPEMFYHAPDAEALAAIYRQIAPTIGCPLAHGGATFSLPPEAFAAACFQKHGLKRLAHASFSRFPQPALHPPNSWPILEPALGTGRSLN